MGVALFTNYFTSSIFIALSGSSPITASCWGGGQGGGASTEEIIEDPPGEFYSIYYSAPGGTGGSYARKTLNITSGSTYQLVVGRGGAG